MPMGKEVPIGPFVKGMSQSDTVDLDNMNSAWEIVNFDIQPDGTLYTRKPLLAKNNGTNRRVNVIGFFVQGSGFVYTIVNTDAGVYAVSPNGSGTLITNNPSHVALQYADKLWVICYSGVSGRWDPVGGFTVIPAMPLGASAVIKNDRLLVTGVTNEAKLYWSDAGVFSDWVGAGGGETTVRTQDGGYLQKLVHYNDQVLVFKDRGTWILSFTADPGEGTLRLISPTVGTQNPFTACGDTEQVYTYFSGQIYRLENNELRVISISLKHSLTAHDETNDPSDHFSAGDPALPYDANHFCGFVDETRVVFKIEEKYWVWNSYNQAWAEYQFANNSPGPIMAIPSLDDGVSYDYLSGGTSLTDTNLYEWVGWNTDSTVYPVIPFDAWVTTKGLTFGATTQFKRLFHWGVDALHEGTIAGAIVPITAKQPATWAAVGTRKWNELGTWNNLLGPLQGFTESIYTTTFGLRAYIKFSKSTRFRRANFRVTFSRETKGSQFFTLRAFVKASELVSARES